MRTYTGQLVPCLKGGEDAEVNLIDLTVHLGRTRRFGGLGDLEWTVLHHSMLCGMIHLSVYGVEGMWHTLIHDCHEAYIGDIPSPVKRALGKEQIENLASKLDARINEKFGLTPGNKCDEFRKHVCDLVALLVESHYFGPTRGPSTLAEIGRLDWGSVSLNIRRETKDIVVRLFPEVAAAMDACGYYTLEEG